MFHRHCRDTNLGRDVPSPLLAPPATTSTVRPTSPRSFLPPMNWNIWSVSAPVAVYAMNLRAACSWRKDQWRKDFWGSANKRDKQTEEAEEEDEEESPTTSSRGDDGWLLVHVSGVTFACDLTWLLKSTQWASGRLTEEKRMRMNLSSRSVTPPSSGHWGLSGWGGRRFLLHSGEALRERFWCRFISFSFESRLYFLFAFYCGKFSNIINIEI